MDDKLRVAGYVKLAKLWERCKDKAIILHNNFFINKFADSELFSLVDVYIDITGAKNIFNRPEMIRLLKDIINGKIDCIYTQTRAYLAANMKEFCYLLKFIFDFNTEIQIITEDEEEYNICTISDFEQKQALVTMVDDVVQVDSDNYKKWKERVLQSISNQVSERK